MKLSTCLMVLATLAVAGDARELKTYKSESECLNELTYDECFAYRYGVDGGCMQMWLHCNDRNYGVNSTFSNKLYGCEGGKSLMEYMSTCMRSPSTIRYSEKDVQTCLKKTNADKQECMEYFRPNEWSGWSTKLCSCKKTWNMCRDTWITSSFCYTHENYVFRRKMEKCLIFKPPVDACIQKFVKTPGYKCPSAGTNLPTQGCRDIWRQCGEDPTNDHRDCRSRGKVFLTFMNDCLSTKAAN